MLASDWVIYNLVLVVCVDVAIANEFEKIECNWLTVL